LGGFGGQLTADELLRAQALVGGTPAPQPAPDMSVQRAAGRPAQQIRAYGDADLSDQNRQIELAGQMGTEQSANAAQRGQMRTQQAEQQRGHNEQARTDATETRVHKKGLREEQDHLLDEMRANLEPPSKSAGERIWGILGGILAMGSEGRAMAGVNFITQLAGSGREQRWAQAQQSRSAMYQAVTRGIDLDNSTEEQQFEVARRMGAADALYWDNAIEAEKEKGLSGAALKEAENLQLGLRQKARGLLRADSERDLKTEEAAKKAGAAAAKTRRERYFWEVPLPELRAMPSQVLSKDGQEILAKRIKQEQDPRANEAAISIAEGKAKGEQGPEQGQLVPGGRRIRDPGVYGLIEKPTLTKYVDGETKASSALRNIDELQQLVATHGTETLPGEAKRKMQFLEKQIKLDLKDAGELGTWDRGSAEVLGEMIGDPTAWLGEGVEGVGTRLDEAKHMIKYKTELRAKSLGLEYDRGSIGEVPKPDNDPRVRKGFVAPNASDRGVQTGGQRAPFTLPQSNLSLDDIRRAQQRAQALDQGVPMAWVK
jgi:hypothetical protein